MSTFQFKHFSVSQSNTTMKVGTDSMLLGAFVDADNPQSILDIGTGTGVIALMMAQRFSNAQIIGLEIDTDAYLEASANFERSNWDERLLAINADILEAKFERQFDLIVSNPPYYENSLLANDDRTSRAKHAEFLPMDSLLDKVQRMLTENGVFWVIIPSENAKSWVKQAEVQDLCLHRRISIIGKEGQGEKRCVLAFCSGQKALEKSSLAVRDPKGNYTKEYIELTKEFHDRDLSK